VGELRENAFAAIVARHRPEARAGGRSVASVSLPSHAALGNTFELSVSLRICEAGHDVLVSYPRIIRHDVGFVPSLGHQSITNSTESRVPRMTGLPASTADRVQRVDASVVIEDLV
jgi:hypothetical protein